MFDLRVKGIPLRQRSYATIFIAAFGLNVGHFFYGAPMIRNR